MNPNLTKDDNKFVWYKMHCWDLLTGPYEMKWFLELKSKIGYGDVARWKRELFLKEQEENVKYGWRSNFEYNK